MPFNDGPTPRLIAISLFRRNTTKTALKCTNVPTEPTITLDRSNLPSSCTTPAATMRIALINQERAIRSLRVVSRVTLNAIFVYQYREGHLSSDLNSLAKVMGSFLRRSSAGSRGGIDFLREKEGAVAKMEREPATVCPRIR
jgi:hypothetical protein